MEMESENQGSMNDFIQQEIENPPSDMVVNYQDLSTQVSEWSTIYDEKYIDKNDKNGFQVLYLDKTKSGKNKFVEKLPNVKAPVFAGVSDRYRGVRGNNIAIYYFGHLNIEEEKVIAVNVNQSWADTIPIPLITLTKIYIKLS